jgi:mannan endo-1,4-beta-mannosidase
VRRRILAASLLAAAMTTGAASAAGPSAALSDPDANPRTRALYTWLLSIQGKQTLAGQQDLTWDDSVDMAARVFADTGKYPALMGYDFMNTGQSGQNGKPAQGLHQADEAIAFARRGGLVTFCWHWRDPALLGTPDFRRAGFYVHDPDPARNTGFTIPVAGNPVAGNPVAGNPVAGNPVAGARLDTGSAAYRQLDAGIDLIAGELKRLQDAGVSVLWRPLHEASGNEQGGWFWWGRKRADGVAPARAYILLWRHMHERLVEVHGLHNLVWVWNGQDPAWYPGDDVVDIVGWDIYDDSDARTYKSQVETYRKLRAIPGTPKPVALSETSYIPDPDRMQKDGAPWLWFTVWNDARAGVGVSAKDNFWSGDYYNTAQHKNKVYHHPNVIMLDALPAFLKAPQ